MRTSGSSRRPGVSGSREPAISGDFDSVRARATDASPGTVRKISSSAQRSSPVVSSDQKHSTSGRNKNLESSLKGIEGLHINDERLHH